MSCERALTRLVPWLAIYEGRFLRKNRSLPGWQSPRPATTSRDEKCGGSKLVGVRCSSQNIRSPCSRKLMVERNSFVKDSYNELVRVDERYKANS